ncbi:hypothetical protein GOBAR_AA28188 [Gossypium barbadense]|uniref:Uncharacterized protein n=1 Tax=Gossypium barbadense TaxID=3634 RepID=A0A2P5WN42_GOSBA|nr:hypothetical protein GOBAR_AA28188 [Gossypium barbadense]
MPVAQAGRAPHPFTMPANYALTEARPRAARPQAVLPHSAAQSVLSPTERAAHHQHTRRAHECLQTERHWPHQLKHTDKTHRGETQATQRRPGRPGMSRRTYANKPPLSREPGSWRPKPTDNNDP